MVIVWVGAGLTRRSCLRREARWFPPGWMRGRIWGWVIGTYADCTRWRWMFKYNGWCYPKGTCYHWPWWILVIICWYKISIDLFGGIALWRNGTHGLTGDVLVLYCWHCNVLLLLYCMVLVMCCWYCGVSIVVWCIVGFVTWWTFWTDECLAYWC